MGYTASMSRLFSFPVCLLPSAYAIAGITNLDHSEITLSVTVLSEAAPVFGASQTTPVVARRSLDRAHHRKTSLSSLSPVVSSCGDQLSSLTIATGAGLNADLTCTHGTETWNVEGTDTSYTVCALLHSRMHGAFLLLSCRKWDGVGKEYAVKGRACV